jgi:hypothetical protein
MKKSVKAPRPTPVLQRFWSIEHLPGLDAQEQKTLLECGIETTLDLLRRTSTPERKRSLSAQLHIHLQHIHKWAALADLARIPAVGCQYCGLLLHTGIVSPEQLAQTPLQTLHKMILRFYVTHLRRQDLCPSQEQLARWIQQARELSGLT